MKLLFGAAALAAVFAAAPAFAQNPVETFLTDASAYGTIGYSRVQAEGDELISDTELDAITGRAGVRFGRFVGVEGEASFGVDESSVNVLGESLDVELDASFGLYLMGVVPITPNAEVHGRVGVGRTSISAGSDDLDVSASASEQSFNYGLGGSYFFDGKNGVRGDYTRFQFDGDDSEEGGEFDVLSISYIRRF